MLLRISARAEVTPLVADLEHWMRVCKATIMDMVGRGIDAA